MDRDFTDTEGVTARETYRRIRAECPRMSPAKALRWTRLLRGGRWTAWDWHKRPTTGKALARIEQEVAELHSYPWGHDPNGTYLGLYRAHLCYGGSEEGGWWYTDYEPVLAKRVDHLTEEQQRALAARVSRAAESSWNGRSYRSAAGGETFYAWVDTGTPTYNHNYTPYC